MSTWKRLFKNSRRHKEPKIKKAISFQGLLIKLYEIDWTSSEVLCNIKAYNMQGKPLWAAEAPTHSLHYWDMQVDEESGILDADSGSGRHYKISLADGCILSSELIK